MLEFAEPAAVIVKHNNPCGVSIGTDILDAYLTAREVNPASAYGSVVSLNREVDKKLAEAIDSTFVEVVVAPSFTKEAFDTMKKKENMRVLILPERMNTDEVRTIDGGILVQRTPPYTENWTVITDRDPTTDEMQALRIAWKVCKHAKSNTIIFADQKHTLGIGAGQMSGSTRQRSRLRKPAPRSQDLPLHPMHFSPFLILLRLRQRPVPQHLSSPADPYATRKLLKRQTG